MGNKHSKKNEKYTFYENIKGENPSLSNPQTRVAPPLPSPTYNYSPPPTYNRPIPYNSPTISSYSSYQNFGRSDNFEERILRLTLKSAEEANRYQQRQRDDADLLLQLFSTGWAGREDSNGSDFGGGDTTGSDCGGNSGGGGGGDAGSD